MMNPEEVQTAKERLISDTGNTIEAIAKKVRIIVDETNPSRLSIQDVREKLEEWLESDLSDHWVAIRALVFEAC